MSEYDGLPLDTPTKVAEDSEVEVWATRTANGGTVERRPKTGSRLANNADLLSKLSQLIDDAAAANTALQTIRDRADLAAGTLTTAVLSAAARQLQADTKTQANIQQQTIQRVVALARLTVGALDSTAGT